MMSALSCIAVLSMAGAGPGLTVRVDSRGGAPRLLVNGKPVRARMFFGGPGANPIRIGPAGREISFEFTPTVDSGGGGTMHFRFGQKPGVIDLDDVRVVDAATGKAALPTQDFETGEDSFTREWYTWPLADRNTVGTQAVTPGAGRDGTAGLRVRIVPPPDGSWPDYHIHHAANLPLTAGATYRVTLWARADPERDLSIGFYKPGDTYIHLGGPPSSYEAQIKMAAGAGVDFVSYVIPTPWPKPGEPVDWTGVDAECERVLRANPKALLLPRIGMDPPAWWAEAYPDDMMLWENKTKSYTAVVASPFYLADGAARLEALVRHLEEKYGDRVAGYHPCGQNTGEWFTQNTWEGLLSGYAPADVDGWRRWLQGSYHTDAALQSAWHDPTAAIEAAIAPSPSERRASPNGVLRDPVAERRLVDFALYQNDAMADCVCRFAAAVRKGSAGRKLVVFFYGYGFEFGGVVLGPATSAHYALRRVLRSPDIDIVCSPISYGDRDLAGTGPVMSCAESVALAGKMWLQEDDTRTHASPDEPDAIARLMTLPESVATLTRNVANEATRNMASWWMDLGMAGWFNDPGLWNAMKRLEPVDRPFIDGAIPFRPEVAAVLDERSQMLIGPNVHDVTGPMIYQARWQLGRLGAPYGQYLLDDVVTGKVGAKVLVFLNAWWLDAAQRRGLASAAKGRTKVWCYAPTMYGEVGPDPTVMKDVTGFELRRVEPKEAWAEPTAEGKRLGLMVGFGLRRAVDPIFAAADATPAETLATYPDGSAAVAMRKTSAGVSMFVGVPGLTPQVLRIAARAAGVHLYTDGDACIAANGPIVSVHAVKEGPVRVNTGSKGPAVDALTGAKLGSGPKLTLTMHKGDTVVLRVRPPAPNSGRGRYAATRRSKP